MGNGQPSSVDRSHVTQDAAEPEGITGPWVGSYRGTGGQRHSALEAIRNETVCPCLTRSPIGHENTGATEDYHMSMPARCVLASLALLVSWSTPLRAHDIYTGLTDKDGTSCCNNLDCRPVQYRMTPVGVQVLVDGKWIAVPDDTIQYRVLPGDTGETGGAHWCGWTTNWKTKTYCTILPPNSAGLSAHSQP